MLNKYPVIKTINRFIFPFLVFFALYIQLNGETSPGGGFQAGAIFASAVIAFSLASNALPAAKANSQQNLLSHLRIIASSGALIYLATGLISLLSGGQYLDYALLSVNPTTGQKIGIFIIELGVGLTVASAMLLIYFLFDEE